MALPPGPSTPAAFNLAQYVRRPLQMLAAWQRRYGPVFTLKLTFFGTGVYVADPDAIRELFTGDQADLRAGEANAFLEPMMGSRSVLVLDGPEHMRLRKLLLAQFGGAQVQAFRERIRDAVARELAGWRPGARVILRDRMRVVTFDVICRTVLGVTDDAQIRRLRSAFVAVVDSSPAYLVLSAARADLGPLSPGRRFAQRVRAVDELLLAEISRRRADAELSTRDDVLSLLLRAGDEQARPLEDGELRDALFTLLTAGYETTATSLAFAFELLLRNPDALGRLRDELAAGDGDEYLEAVIKESLRLRPAIDNTERTLTEPRTVAGFELPAGIKVYPGIVAVHLREDLYARAHEFRPERFLDGGGVPYSWLPFGGGIRRCIGAALAQAQMAEVLRATIPTVSLRPVRDRPDPVVMRGITLAPRYGVEVEITDLAR
jgi:cytochrome P450 family 135